MQVKDLFKIKSHATKEDIAFDIIVPGNGLIDFRYYSRKELCEWLLEQEYNGEQLDSVTKLRKSKTV